MLKFFWVVLCWSLLVWSVLWVWNSNYRTPAGISRAVRYERARIKSELLAAKGIEGIRGGDPSTLQRVKFYFSRLSNRYPTWFSALGLVVFLVALLPLGVYLFAAPSFVGGTSRVATSAVLSQLPVGSCVNEFPYTTSLNQEPFAEVPCSDETARIMLTSADADGYQICHLSRKGSFCYKPLFREGMCLHGYLMNPGDPKSWRIFRMPRGCNEAYAEDLLPVGGSAVPFRVEVASVEMSPSSDVCSSGFPIVVGSEYRLCLVPRA